MIFLYRLVYAGSQVYFYLILANVLLSWFPHNRMNPIFRFIHELTDPYLNLIRRYTPFLRFSAIDFSPVFALLVLELAAQVILRLLLLLM